jgi:hypothetical protein
MAETPNRTWENRLSGIIGGLRKRGHGGNGNPPRSRKSEDGNPPPTAGAPELYPNFSIVIVRPGHAIAVSEENQH